MADSAFPWPVHPAAELFPLLGDTELTELADDVRTRALLEPVWLYDDPERGTVLLDGRNRALACQRAGVEIGTRLYTGDDPIGFSVAQNVKRRHLTPGQLGFLAHDAAALYAADAAATQAAAVAAANRRRTQDHPDDGPQDTSENDDAVSDVRQTDDDFPYPAGSRDMGTAPERDPVESYPVADDAEQRRAERRERRERETSERAAKVTGASGRNVSATKRIGKVAPDLADQVRAGKMAVNRAERIIRDREAEARRIAEAKRDAEAAEEKTTVDIRHGDFRDVLADVSGVDAIITDPPYPHEFIPLLEDLAKWADQVLTPDGVLCVLIGQTYLPEVYRLLEGHRPYRWTGCYLTGGAGYVSWQRKVQSNWKPLLVYGGGPRFGDVIRSEGTDANAKALHKWGQDYSAFHTIVDRFTSRGQTVADPFMGAGTTLLAARALGRHAIGCDIDAEHVATARDRLT